MRLIGLTGGIASGKSEAAKRFRDNGIPVLDADIIGHEVIAPGGAAEQAVIEAFGEDILSHGLIDREKLGRLVFASEEARLKLNSIVHPAISAEIARRCGKLAEHGEELAIIDAALLAEKGRRETWISALVVVDSDWETRLARLMETRGMSRAEAEKRMRAQTPAAEKVALADWVVDNNGSLDALYRQVDTIAGKLKHDGR